MMTPEGDVEAHALRKQGWTISATARHLDRDRKSVRAYLNGERQPGVSCRGEVARATERAPGAHLRDPPGSTGPSSCRLPRRPAVSAS
jgi:hypothetical protein